MNRIMLIAVACPTLPYFSQNGQDFQRGEKVIEHKMCILIFSATRLKHLSF
jgi:hypothetical protein